MNAIVKKRKRRNKAKMIRETLTELGKDTPAKDVIRAMGLKKVRVTAPQVYMAKASLNGTTTKRRKRGSGFESILHAKRFVDSTGSLEEAKEALSVLSQLQRMKPR